MSASIMTLEALLTPQTSCLPRVTEVPLSSLPFPHRVPHIEVEVGAMFPGVFIAQQAFKPPVSQHATYWRVLGVGIRNQEALE